MDVGFHAPKMEKDHPDCYPQKVQKPASRHRWSTVYEGTIDAEAYVRFLRDICCRQDSNFSQELHVYFSRTMPGLILHEFQQRGFVGIECVCLTGLPTVQICLLLKMYRASWGGESDHGTTDCWAAQVLYTKNGQKFHGKLWHLISAVPKRLLSVITRKGASLPTVNECVAGINV